MNNICMQDGIIQEKKNEQSSAAAFVQKVKISAKTILLIIYD